MWFWGVDLYKSCIPFSLQAFGADKRRFSNTQNSLLVIHCRCAGVKTDSDISTVGTKQLHPDTGTTKHTAIKCYLTN